MPHSNIHGGSVPMLGFGASPSMDVDGLAPTPWLPSRTVAAQVDDGASMSPWIWAPHHHVLLVLQERAVVPFSPLRTIVRCGGGRLGEKTTVAWGWTWTAVALGGAGEVLGLGGRERGKGAARGRAEAAAARGRAVAACEAEEIERGRGGGGTSDG